MNSKTKQAVKRSFAAMGSEQRTAMFETLSLSPRQLDRWFDGDDEALASDMPGKVLDFVHGFYGYVDGKVGLQRLPRRSADIRSLGTRPAIAKGAAAIYGDAAADGGLPAAGAKVIAASKRPPDTDKHSLRRAKDAAEAKATKKKPAILRMPTFGRA